MYAHGRPPARFLSQSSGGSLPASTILVLESPTTGDASLAPHLTSAGYTVTQTTDPDEALAKIVEYQLAVIDVGVIAAPPKTSKSGRPMKESREAREAREAAEAHPPKTGMELCREIRATPAMAAVPILCVASTAEV